VVIDGDVAHARTGRGSSATARRPENAAAVAVQGRRFGQRLGPGDALRDGENANVNDDHYDERHVEGPERGVQLVPDLLTQMALTLRRYIQSTDSFISRLYIGLFSGTVLNVRKHIFERKHRKSSRNFISSVNKQSLVIGCNKSMIRHNVI